MRYLFLSLLAVSALLLPACQPQQELSMRRVPTLTVLFVKSTPESDSLLQGAITDYGRVHSVQVSSKSCSILEMLALATDSTSPDRPDVLILPFDYIPALAENASIIQQDTDTSVIVAALTSACVWNGRNYGTPLSCEIPVVVVNKNLDLHGVHLDRGLTISDLIHLTESPNTFNGTIWAVHGEDPGALTRTITAWFAIFGGSILDTNGQPAVNSKDNIRALTAYADLARGSKMETRRQLRAECSQGTIGLWYTTSSMSQSLLSSNRGSQFELSFLHESSSNQRPNALFGTAAAISAMTHDTALSRDVITYLRDRWSQPTDVGFPASSTFWRSTHERGDTSMKVLCQKFITGRPIRTSPQWLALQSIVEEAVLRVLYGQATAKESLDRAQVAIQEIQR